jgi:CRISPR-associated protein Cmx8
MTSASSVDQALPKQVHGLVKTYVYRKSESKSGIKWAEFKNKKVKDESTGKERINVPQRYREIREKVCADAFLRLRACKAREDFVAYFTGTICSVPQFLPEPEYQIVADAILTDERWEEVKALTMLALSGLSNV